MGRVVWTDDFPGPFPPKSIQGCVARCGFEWSRRRRPSAGHGYPSDGTCPRLSHYPDDVSTAACLSRPFVSLERMVGFSGGVSPARSSPLIEQFKRMMQWFDTVATAHQPVGEETNPTTSDSPSSHKLKDAVVWRRG